MTIVHIGLGKTATTALQKRVFPELVKFGLISAYNPKNLMRLLYLKRLTELTKEQEAELAKLVKANKDAVVSFEGLVDWNPVNWKQARDENLATFGKDATILLTIREPRGYLTSVYQQVVAEGHVVEPKNFFVSTELASLAASANRRGMLEYFDQQHFDMAKLADLYREKFSQVIVVAMPQLGSMNFLDAFISIDEASRAVVQKNFNTLEPNNRSFSRLAMSLTLRRERLLNSLGIRSQSTHDFDIRALENFTKPIAEPIAESSGKSSGKPAPRRSALKRLKRKAWVWSKRLRRWRYLMQVVVNRGFVYKKYELPAGILNESVIKKNLEFYNEVLAAKDGYLVLGRLNGRNRKS
jgi:hypothetical protein